LPCLDWISTDPFLKPVYSFPSFFFMIHFNFVLPSKYSKSSSDFVPPFSYLTSCTPTKSNLSFDCSCATVFVGSALYKLLTLHATNPISIFFYLNRSGVPVKMQRPLQHYVTNWFLRDELLDLTQVGASPVANCPWLIFQYIHSHLMSFILSISCHLSFFMWFGI
jgi:hypothetical protein